MKTDPVIKVLLIEKKNSNSRLIKEILETAKGRFAINQAYTLSEGLDEIAFRNFDVVILDLSLSESFGVLAVDTLIKKAPQLPIIVLADANDAQLAEEAVQKGAQDFLIKEEAPTKVLIRAVNHAIWRKQSHMTLQHTVDALKKANERIMGQQKSVIEEERLKMMLQMAGTTAHELNQPLMSLLGYIELIELKDDDLDNHLANIKKAGKRISKIVRKIQSIRLDGVIAPTDAPGIVDLDRDITILSLEDSDHDFGRLADLLKNQPQIHLLRSVTLKEAFTTIAADHIELIFLDHVLPDGDSFDFMRMMTEKKLQIPVVVITGQGDEMIASQIIQAGAYDYINKDHLNLPSVIRIVKNAMEKFHLKKEMQKAFEKITEMATRDELTGLNNRRLLQECLQREMLRTERFGSDLSCLMIDLDHFKQINDTFGHIFGDQVLKEFAADLKELVRSTDLTFRYGGEEFAILLPETHLYGCIQIAEKIRSHFEKKIYRCKDDAVTITVSIGAASAVHHQTNEGQTLLSLADKALYAAKANGRNQVQIYKTPEQSTTGSSGVPIQYVKEKIQLLLEKTRKSAIASIERLVTDRSQLGYQTETQRVVQCLELLAQKLKFPIAIVDTLKQAARLHDYLQIILMESLLYKQTPLSDAEKAEIEDHPHAIAEMVSLFDFFSDVRQILQYHHEHYDGSGYPEGLSGDQIPIGARLLAVVNAFVAMTSQKSYRTRMPDNQVVEELVHGAKTQFDPVMVALVLDMIAQHHLLEVNQEEMEKAIQKVKRICESSKASLKNLICRMDMADSEKLNICRDQ